MFEAIKPVYLTKDRQRCVEEGDPEAKFLLANPGMRLKDALLEGVAGADQFFISSEDPTRPEPVYRGVNPVVTQKSPTAASLLSQDPVTSEAIFPANIPFADDEEEEETDGEEDTPDVQGGPQDAPDGAPEGKTPRKGRKG